MYDLDFEDYCYTYKFSGMLRRKGSHICRCDIDYSIGLDLLNNETHIGLGLGPLTHLVLLHFPIYMCAYINIGMQPNPSQILLSSLALISLSFEHWLHYWSTNCHWKFFSINGLCLQTKHSSVQMMPKWKERWMRFHWRIFWDQHKLISFSKIHFKKY